MHQAAAFATQTPELMLSPEEGANLTKAAQNVMRHYAVEASQKVVDWVALAMVAMGIYAPRVVAIAARRRAMQYAAPETAANGAGPEPDIHFPADPSMYHTDGMQ